MDGMEDRLEVLKKRIEADSKRREKRLKKRYAELSKQIDDETYVFGDMGDESLGDLLFKIEQPMGWACFDYPGGMEQLRKDVEAER